MTTDPRNPKRGPLHRWHLATCLWAVSCALPLVSGQTSSAPAARPAGAVSRREAVALLQETFASSSEVRTDDDYTQMIQSCERALAMRPEKKWVDYAHRLAAFAHDKRGELRSVAGQEAAAMDDFDKAITHNPRRWQAVHNRAVSHAMLGNLKAAQTDFDRTIRLRPQYSNAYFNRAELLREAGQLPLAVADYDQALKLHPQDLAALVGRGQARFKLNQLDTALADCESVLAIHQAEMTALILRGDIRRMQGQFRAAADDYQAAIDADPLAAPAYQAAAWLMATCPEARVRSPETAIAYAEKAREISGQETPELLNVLAAAHASAGDYRQARKTQMQALAMAPQTSAYRQRLQLYEQQRPLREGGSGSLPRSRVASGAERTNRGAKTR